MTHSGGKPHAVGYEGQQFEVRVFDEDQGEEIVVGWTDSETKAESWAQSLETRPTWTNGRFIDLKNPAPCGINCTVCEGQDHHWIEDAPENPIPGLEVVLICKHCEIRIPMPDDWGE